LRLDDYGLGEQIKGLIFALQPTTYMLGTFGLPYLIPEWVPYRVTIFISLVLVGISTLLIGPFS